MMKDVYVFLYTRLTCLDEGVKLESSVDETVRLKDLGQEVNKIRPFLRSNPDQQSGALAHIQRLLMELLVKAQQGTQLTVDPLIQRHMNDTGDVLLGSICLILSNDTSLLPSVESCGSNKSKKTVESIILDYSARMKGVSGTSVDLGRDEDRFLDLVQLKSCGHITVYHQNKIRSIISKP